MKHRYRYMLAALIATPFTPAQAQETLAQALREGDAALNLRLRYEDVEQDGVEDADALTLRTRLSYTSGAYNGFSVVLEMDDVTALTDVDYADGTGRNSNAAVIADPEGTEVNQAYLAYNNWNTTFRYGRQRILLDNQRFVGGVGWRQNEQTYDAFSVANNSVDGLSLFYAYVHNVNRVFGEGAVAGDNQQDSHLLNARFSGWSGGSLIGYAYLIDNETLPALSSDTYGARWEGRINPAWAYNLEYATQREAGDNPADYSADYMLAEVVATVQRFTFTAGYERLGSDNGNAAFSTPFATLHAFQGWTDKFLTTPPAGIEDLYLGASTDINGTRLALVYHDLSANEGSADYGSEVGFTAARGFGPVNLLLKYADYNADDFATDTRKLWLMAEATF